MDKLMAQFIEEARELLANAGQNLLKLEKSPADERLIDDIFRDVHTLKGSGGVLDIQPLVQVLHRAEECLELARTQPQRMDADNVDALLDSLDQVGAWIDELDSRETLGEDAAAVAGELDQRLAGLLGDAAHGDDAADGGDDSGEGTAWGLFDDPTNGEGQAWGLFPDTQAREAPAWLGLLAEATARWCWRTLAAEGGACWVDFRPDAGCFYRGDDPLFMAGQAPGLLALHAGLDASDEPLETLDVFQCRLRIGLVCQGERSEIDQHFQYEDGTVAIAELMPEYLIQPVGEAGTAPAADRLAELHDLHAQRRVNDLMTALEELLDDLDADSRQASLVRWLQEVVETRPDDALVFDAVLAALEAPVDAPATQGGIDWDKHLGGAVSTEPETPPASPTSDDPSRLLDPQTDAVGTVISDQQRLMQLCRDAELRPGSFDAARRVLDNTARALGAGLPEPVARAASADVLQDALSDWLSDPDGKPVAAAEDAEAAATGQPESSRKEEASAADPPAQADGGAEPSVAKRPAAPPTRAGNERDNAAPVIRAFKIDQEQVADLGDLVGELVVAKNALPFLAQRAEQVFGERQLGREIREQFNVINRITRSLQDAMMAVQMLPVSYVFDRFPRLVRDLSRKLGKSIELSVSGEDTEAEKHVIESLADPLVHLMRNSIDHGIEPPEARRAAGKAETGRIELSARQENEFVVIEVNDDGGGIDPAKTRMRAYEKGLVEERRLQEMTDAEAIELIFMPGFSTLDEATELSGRGVGMDVVRTTVEKAGGRLDVDSEIGRGSRFSMSLPLSMSVSQVMQIWIDDQRYGIPMDQVAETVRLPAARLHRFKDRETLLLRDRVVPVCRAREQLGLVQPEDGDTVSLLVVRQRGELVALMVDDFSEGVEVILKPMEGALENLGVYQGTALLGDGSVLLVLNPGVLLSTVKLEEGADEHSG